MGARQAPHGVSRWRNWCQAFATSIYCAARRARPRARRALIILRPLLVFIRARKPCLRARLRRPGWKVCFIVA